MVDTCDLSVLQLTNDTRQSYQAPASEQQYAEPVSSSNVNVEPTREELNDVAKAVSRLWELDVNRLTPGRDYEIDVGDGKKVYQKEDNADAALFRNLDRNVFNKPTYGRFYALLDNYSSDERVAEKRTSEEQHEETAFIEEISRTAPIQYLHKYLQAKNVIQGDDQEYKNALRSLWFDLYNRGGTRGSSSAFEHVFVGEIKHDRNSNETEVSGLHNWIQVNIAGQYFLSLNSFLSRFSHFGVLKHVPQFWSCTALAAVNVPLRSFTPLLGAP